MRIISALLVLRIIFWLIMPQTALATEVIKSNETNTNFKTQPNSIMLKEITENESNVKLNEIPDNFEGFYQVKNLEESRREQILNKFKQKKKTFAFPQKKFTINASAYTASADECGKSDGITASGLHVKESETIACPYQFPFGTKLNINGMGTYICEDRGGAIKGNHIDIYMKTKKEAFTFGRRNLVAEVII